MKIKKAKATQKCAIKTKPKFEVYKSCLEAIQLENEINQLGKKINKDSLREKRKEFIKNNKLILKFQQ